jgi:probable rRNA maturation factor
MKLDDNKSGHMVTIQVKRRVKLPFDKSILLRAAQTTLEATSTAENSAVSIVVGNDDLLHKLNMQYRQVDTPTDVLSFPSGEVDPDTSDVYLGDVVISLPRAHEQASAEGHPIVEEVQLLVIHGILHLLGYDHENAKDKKRMQVTQDSILTDLGVGLKSPM